MEVFCKRKLKHLAINELIGARLAAIYGLLCPFYYVIPDKEDESYCYIFSKNIAQLGQFNMIKTYIDMTTLYGVWDALDDKGYDSAELMPQVVKMYIYDVIFANSDRSEVNWGVLTTHDGANKVVIFDNENLFSKRFPVFISSDFDEVRFGAWGDEEFASNNRMQEIANFFRQSTKEYQDLFVELYEKVTPEVFRTILEDIEQASHMAITDKEKRIAAFTANFEMIGKAIEEFRGVKKG